MTMSAEEKEQIAQERYGKSFDELSTNEQKGVGGVHGGHAGGPIGGTVNKTPEEREKGVVHHEPQN
ncbi:hypothetical protein V8C86DRAFT_741677 [Haematococcus lacustris]